MKVNLIIDDKFYGVVYPGHDISIPVKFNGKQPSMYGVPGATSVPYEGEGFIGDVRMGGSVNFETIQITPHCNGTHTECVGHISLSRISVQKVLKESVIPATLISITPVRAAESGDTYSPDLMPDDLVIDRASMEKALKECSKEFIKSIVIRTLPNEADKKERDYMKKPPAFFSIEAMQSLRALDVRHLLIDLPSVDKLYDEGRLSSHHIFWGVPQGSYEVNPNSHSLNTITELVYIPDTVPDGEYLLNLQIAPFESDAAPSRPVLYQLKEIDT